MHLHPCNPSRFIASCQELAALSFDPSERPVGYLGLIERMRSLMSDTWPKRVRMCARYAVPTVITAAIMMGHQLRARRPTVLAGEAIRKLT
jgi:hypothetical protein